MRLKTLIGHIQYINFLHTHISLQVVVKCVTFLSLYTKIQNFEKHWHILQWPHCPVRQDCITHWLRDEVQQNTHAVPYLTWQPTCNIIGKPLVSNKVSGKDFQDSLPWVGRGQGPSPDCEYGQKSIKNCWTITFDVFQSSRWNFEKGANHFPFTCGLWDQVWINNVTPSLYIIVLIEAFNNEHLNSYIYKNMQ